MAGEAKHLSGHDPRNEPSNVVPLGKDPPPEPPPPETPPRGLHAYAIAAATAFVVVAILSFIAFLTIRWPGDTGRTVVTVGMFSVVGAIASASAATLSAARATYPGTTKRDEPADDTQD